MARALTFELDEIMTRGDRRPGWRVEIFDVRSTTDTITEIVRGVTLKALTGPLDVTPNLSEVGISEVAGDFVSSGINSSKITLRIVDPTPGNVASVWDPQFSAGDSTLPARFLRKGNVVRVREGDARVDAATWPITFTGILIGQPGVDRGRSHDAQGRSLVSMSAVTREGKWVSQSLISEQFARGAGYLTMAGDVASNLMQLDADEIDLFGWGTQTTGLQIQFAKQSPLTSIAQLMFVDAFMPRFDGEGKLTQTSGDITKAPARIYLNLETIKKIDKPFSDLEVVNSVHVIGIEGVKSKTTLPRQGLREVELTTGYFTSDEEIEVFWTDDQTQLAEGIALTVIKSVNGGLSILGGGETFEEIPCEGTSGFAIGARLSLSTGFAPYIIVFLTAAYVVLAAVPDEVVTAVLVGVTVPIGRIAQATALAVIMLLMTKIGRGQYEFVGIPVEYVHKEIKGFAERPALLTEEVNRVTIDNHLVQTQADCDESARLTLERQTARGNPRGIVALHDLRLEPDDIFEVPGDRRFLIEKISRLLIRSEAPLTAEYSVFEVTSGLDP